MSPADHQILPHGTAYISDVGMGGRLEETQPAFWTAP